MSRTDGPREVPHVAFVLEQTLGHVTHGKNLRDLVPEDGRVDASFLGVDFEPDSMADRLPPLSNWTVRAGVRARRAIGKLDRDRSIDAMFIHTQVPAVLNAGMFDRIPAVVSIDATPRQYDELGSHYNHDQGGERAEAIKWRLNRRCFRRAAHLVTWSQWAKDGLVADYDVRPENVSVIPPGVDPARWTRSATARSGGAGDPARILFVGSDFARKGGNDLLSAFRDLRARQNSDAARRLELHIVTTSDVDVSDGITVHRGITPNSPELIELYHSSDVFCLPTYGDCLPMVLSEAGAAELALVSTDVGAISEVVRHGENGFIIPAGDVGALAQRLEQLASDRALIRRFGEEAKCVVAANYDAAHNARRVVDVVLEQARRRPPRRMR